MGTQATGPSINYAGHVTWAAPDRPVSGYRLQRYLKSAGRCALDPSFSASAPAGAASFTDTAASPGVCGYPVAAVGAGGVSGYHAAWTGRAPTIETTPPLPPVKVNAAFSPGPAGGTRLRTVRITWIDTAAHKSNQLLKRFVLRGGACVEDKPFGVKKLLPDTVSYTGPTAPPDVCAYQVARTNSDGTSMWMGDRDLGPEIRQMK